MLSRRLLATKKSEKVKLTGWKFIYNRESTPTFFHLAIVLRRMNGSLARSLFIYTLSSGLFFHERNYIIHSES